MDISWDQRVDEYWAAADDEHPEQALGAMRALVAERGAEDPDALYEWASVHDFLGLETEAVPLYRAALDRGLSGDRAPRAVVQLASSLRNVGEPEAAVDLLRTVDEPGLGAAPQAFLALALRDAGRPDEALRVALLALAPTLPEYGRSVTAYAEELTAPPRD